MSLRDASPHEYIIVAVHVMFNIGPVLAMLARALLHEQHMSRHRISNQYSWLENEA